jgi:triacylglycerol esterase/lipase EstA (alpha/beta hydrolase family)
VVELETNKETNDGPCRLVVVVVSAEKQQTMSLWLTVVVHGLADGGNKQRLGAYMARCCCCCCCGCQQPTNDEPTWLIVVVHGLEGGGNTVLALINLICH